MKKIKSSFMVAKQNVMEKTHSRENTQETQILKDFERLIDDQAFHLRKICKNINKETTSNAESITDGNALADTFIDYSVKMRDQSDREILTGVLSKVGDFQVGLEDLRAKLNTTLINDVSAPLHSMVKTELKAAKEAKARYDKVRVQYDATIADVVNTKKLKNAKPNKIQEVEEECERQKSMFDVIENETLVLMHETSDVSEFETVEKLCDYLEAYHKFFQKGFRWLNQMLPDIYEYRLYVDRRKSELEKSKVRASMMASGPVVPAVPPNRVFGEELMVTVKRDNAPVPKFITESFNYIREKALDEEGIFRLSGNKREVMEFKAKIDQGNVAGVYAEVVDPSIVASLVKMFLRELPDPLLTFERYQQFLDTINIDDQEERVKQIAKLVDQLPLANHELLRQLLELCTEIASHKSTKMGAANLATVLAPNLLISNSENVQVDDVAIGNMVITAMLQHFDKVFPDGARKSFDWISEGGSAAPINSKPSKGTVRRRPSHPTPATPSPSIASPSISAPSPSGTSPQPSPSSAVPTTIHEHAPSSHPPTYAPPSHPPSHPPPHPPPHPPSHSPSHSPTHPAPTYPLPPNLNGTPTKRGNNEPPT